MDIAPRKRLNKTLDRSGPTALASTILNKHSLNVASKPLASQKANCYQILTSSPYLWFDQSTASGKRFYRAFLLP